MATKRGCCTPSVLRGTILIKTGSTICTEGQQKGVNVHHWLPQWTKYHIIKKRGICHYIICSSLMFIYIVFTIVYVYPRAFQTQVGLYMWYLYLIRITPYASCTTHFVCNISQEHKGNLIFLLNKWCMVVCTIKNWKYL